MNKIIKKISKVLFVFIIYLTLDIIFMHFLPVDIKNKIYDKRTHKIKSYYYHHDLRPNAHWIENWGYKESKIYTNNLGFKDKKIRDIEFKENNILFIGDSFTEGVGVEFENSFVGIIEKEITSKFNDYTVLNAGLSSYSPIIILSKLNYLIEKKIPISKVFLVICGGDFYDDLYRYISINDQYVVNHNDFVNNKILININNYIKSNTLLYQFIREVTPISNLISRFKNNQNVNKKPSYNKKQVLEILNKKVDWEHIVNEEAFRNWGIKGVERSTLYIEKIYKLLKDNNIDLTLVYLDEAISMLNNKNSDFYRKYWETYSERNRIDFIFVDEYHRNNKEKFKIYKELFFIGDNHFNNKGNEIIAKEIMQKSKFLKNLYN